jgi:hypothetical protein
MASGKPSLRQCSVVPLKFPTLGSTGEYIFNLSAKGLTTGTYNLNFRVSGDSFAYRHMHRRRVALCRKTRYSELAFEGPLLCSFAETLTLHQELCEHGARIFNTYGVTLTGIRPDMAVNY